MGGRGSVGKRHARSGGFDITRNVNGQANSIHIAGMNRNIASGVTPEKTLNFIEKQYKKGMQNEQVQIIDENGWVVKAYQGDKNSVAFDVRLTKGHVYTHNHPGNGGQHSPGLIFAP